MLGIRQMNSRESEIFRESMFPPISSQIPSYQHHILKSVFRQDKLRLLLQHNSNDLISAWVSIDSSLSWSVLESRLISKYAKNYLLCPKNIIRKWLWDLKVASLNLFFFCP